MNLSSSEAEWVALWEAAKEMMFAIQLFQSMKSSVKLPVVVRVFNVGTILVLVMLLPQVAPSMWIYATCM